MLVGLDPLGQDQRAGPLVMRHHGSNCAGLDAIGLILHKTQIQLDDVRGDDVEEGQ
jgi:hypothetical protein